MLYRYIEILYQLILLGYGIYQLIGDALGVEIKGAYPVEALYLAKLGKQLGQAALAVNILAVAGGILRNYYQLGNAVIGEPARFFKNILDSAAAEFSSYSGYSAVGAAVRASLGYFQISVKRLSGDDSSAL